MSIAKFNSEGQMRFRSALKDAELNQKEFCKAAGLGESTLKLAKSGGSFSQYSKNRIVEILNEKLRARGKKPITAAWLYEHWQPRPTSTRQNNTLPEVTTFQVQATRSKASIEGADLPDLLTPG